MLAVIKTHAPEPAGSVRGKPAENIMTQLAVIKTGGKQYLVAPGNRVKIEKVEKKDGDEVVFDKVLLVEKSNKIEIGTPYVEGAKVTAKVLRTAKGKKLIVFKFRAKTRYRKKKGHRQTFTEVEIKEIKSEARNPKSETNSKT